MPTLTVNGESYPLPEDPRVTLLDMLRLELGLTGTKKGCDHGQCGACTVLLDGRRVNACLVLACQCADRQVTTVEGLATNGELHPLQQAFVRHDGFQCGYCTPGQLCSAVAMLDEVARQEPSVVTSGEAVEWSREEITERMSGNLCRCGAYPNIVSAIQEVVGK
ncbi:(2Fe-2S)-binding protein [Allohahella sp. A8]|uniref:(2Fe-2S)-binding protein n=1 Tax=Allohahella sp. A8 TaxID=3141461 RepID=UPI003A809226